MGNVDIEDETLLFYKIKAARIVSEKNGTILISRCLRIGHNHPL